MSDLTEDQKKFIKDNIDKYPELSEMTQKVFDDPFLDGRTKEGRAVREYMLSQDLEYKTSKIEPVEDIELTKDDKIIKSIKKEKLSDQKKRIVLTDLGKKVLDYLMNHFSMIINIKFTSLVELDLDKVSKGEIKWQSVVKKVYDSFKDILEIQKNINNISSKNIYMNRELGEYNKSKIILKNGKFGPYITMNNKYLFLIIKSFYVY